MTNLNQQDGINSVNPRKGINKTLMITMMTLLTTLGAHNSNATTIQNKSIPNMEEGISSGYLDNLKSLSSNITDKEFKETRKKIEKTIGDDISDGEVQEIFYGLYDLKSKFNNPKIDKIINKLMERYDPLFNSYNGFDDVRDGLSVMLEDQNNITEDDFIRIENFFDGQGEIKMLYSDDENEEYVNWGQLIIEELIDDEGTESKLQKAILNGIKKLLEKEAISEQQLNHFKNVMATRGIMSSDLDKLKLKTKE